MEGPRKNRRAHSKLRYKPRQWSEPKLRDQPHARHPILEPEGWHSASPYVRNESLLPGLTGSRRPLRQKVGEQVIEIALRNLIGQVGGHGRKLGHGPFLNRILGNAHLFSQRIGQDNDLTLLAQDQDGQTALDYARRSGYIEILPRLEAIARQERQGQEAAQRGTLGRR